MTWQKFVGLLFILNLLSPSLAHGFGVKLDQRKYTCEELKEILEDEGSIWVRYAFLGQWANIAREPYKPHCQGSNSKFAKCRLWPGRLTAKDGRCELGRECFCDHPKHPYE